MLPFVRDFARCLRRVCGHEHQRSLIGDGPDH